MKPARSPLGLILWLVVCAWFNVAGCVLSALGRLDRGGYALVVGFLAVFCGWLVRQRRWKRSPRRRWRRALPVAWAALALLVWLGGLLHAPNHFDALAYRVPRVLHWLAEGQWHWIHTDFSKLNSRAVGFEWLMAPLMALQRTERWTWIFNATGFLLLPGLIFSVFTRLGVTSRAAWRWMWVLPGAYCFALQAGGIGNDLVGAVFALAMMHFALRARAHGAGQDVAWALIAGGLMTGAKSSNLPLLLPGALALLPCWRVALSRPLLLAGAAAVAVLTSFVPMAVQNWRHSGDWTGTRYEHTQALSVTPDVGLPANAIHLAVQNLVPPIFPLAGRWNDWSPRLLPRGLQAKIDAQFERGGLSLTEIQNEDRAGFGFGATLLVLGTAFFGCGRGGRADRWQTLLRWAPLVSALIFMAKIGLSSPARIMAPYYLLIIPALVSGLRCGKIVVGPWWHRAALASLALTALVVVVAPSRPLWPAETVSRWLLVRRPSMTAAERIETVYSVYAQRAEVFAPVRTLLPAEEKRFGLVTSDDPETSLWRPFGSRRFLHVTRDDTAEVLRARGLRTVVVSAEDFETRMGRPFPQWLREMRGELVTSIVLRVRASRASWDWHIVRLLDSEQAGVGKAARMP